MGPGVEIRDDPIRRRKMEREADIPANMYAGLD
jgi:hypothetical protein